MPTQKIGISLLKELGRRAKPATEIRYFDTEAAGFFLRFMPSGAMSYSVQLARGKALSLGDVRGWPSPEDARDKALEARKAYREGAKVTRQDVAAPKAEAAAVRIADVFGLRAKFAADGVEIAGSYRATRAGRSTVEPVALDYFVRFIGQDRPIASVTPNDIRAHFAAESGRRNFKAAYKGKIGRDSMKRHLCVIRCAFAWAKEQDPPLVLANPCDGFKLPKAGKAKDKNAVTRWLRPAEETALRAVLAARDADLIARNRETVTKRRDGCAYYDHLTPLVLLGLNTGGRRGSLHNLRWSHIEREPYDRVRFAGEAAKAGQTYYVPLNAEARAVLASWKPIDAKPNDLVFPNAAGRPFKDVSTAWYTVRLAAGLPDFRFHDTRHTFASKLVQRGISLRAVALLMGHSSQRMTERYANLAPEHGIDGVETLNLPAKATGVGVAIAPASAAMPPAQLRAVLEAAAVRCGVPLADIAAVFLEHGMSVTTNAPA